MKQKMILNIFIYFSCFLFFIFINILLYFYEIPKFLYLGMPWLFAICIYFNWLISLSFIFLIQIIMLNIGQYNAFINYTFCISLFMVFIILFSKILNKKVYFQVIISIILISLIAKPLALLCLQILGNSYYDYKLALSLKSIIEQFKIYVFSGLIAYIFINLFNKNYKKTH